MPQRKPWTAEEDKVLKYLKQERGEKKWSLIAKSMQIQFGIRGKTGKQCRQRYHNHLDESIVITQWTKKEEEVLFEMHESVGNKWSQIAVALPGRSDNCVKNHFYSKLRKAVRRINKIIAQSFKKQFREIKMVLLYKIIEITQLRFKNNSKINEDVIDLCRGLKNRLLLMQDEGREENPEEMEKMKGLIEEIHYFEEKFKKSTRKAKEHKGSTETNYSNTDRNEAKEANKSRQELPFYQIFKKVCEEIMLSHPQ